MTDTASPARVRSRAKPEPVAPDVKVKGKGAVASAAKAASLQPGAITGTADDASDIEGLDDGSLVGDEAPAKGKPGKRSDPQKAQGSELAKVMRDVQKTHGSTAAYRASTRPTFIHVPTGNFALDLMMFGGVPRGLATYITGWRHSGKTTETKRMIAAFQRRFPDMDAAFVDIEGTYDPVWGEKQGIDNDRLVLIQPVSGEVGLDIADAIIRARECSVVAVDSIAGLIPLKEVEASFEDHQMGRRAQLVNKFCLKMQQAMLDERSRDHWPSLLLINQYRQSLAMHGDPRVTPGGKGPEFLASIWLDIKSKEVEVKAKQSMDSSGRGADTGMMSHNEVTLTKRKNKLGNAHHELQFTMIRNPYHPLGEGFIDDAEFVLTEARKRGFITSNSETFRPPFYINEVDQKFGSLDEMVQYCYSDLDFFEHLKTEIICHQRAILKMDPRGWING